MKVLHARFFAVPFPIFPFPPKVTHSACQPSKKKKINSFLFPHCGLCITEWLLRMKSWKSLISKEITNILCTSFFESAVGSTFFVATLSLSLSSLVLPSGKYLSPSSSVYHVRQLKILLLLLFCTLPRSPFPPWDERPPRRGRRKTRRRRRRRHSRRRHQYSENLASLQSLKTLVLAAPFVRRTTCCLPESFKKNETSSECVAEVDQAWHINIWI